MKKDKKKASQQAESNEKAICFCLRNQHQTFKQNIKAIKYMTIFYSSQLISEELKSYTSCLRSKNKELRH